jgi:cytochrome c1
VRRLALIAVLGALVAGCGGGTTVSPTAETVEGQPPPAPQPVAEGDPAAGKQVYDAKGCNGCHTFQPAGSNATTGPPLDDLEGLAEKAGQPLDEFVRESIESPDTYVEEDFPSGVMPAWSGTDKELADLVAFLTKPA